MRIHRVRKPLPLILLPGTLMDGASLQPLMATLERPVVVQLLGVEDDFDAEIDRLATLAEQPAVWVGHSLGGIAALHLAARHPACCAALVVLASNARPDGPQGAHSREQQWAELDRGGMSALLHQQLAPAYGLQDDNPLLDELRAQAVNVGASRFRRQLRYAAERPGLLGAPSALPMPVLALSGSDDSLCPPACGEEIIALSTDTLSRHHVLPGAGHLLPMQAPDWCAHHIRHFLAQLA
ncbi:MAG: alpha/beta hydrolase [Burkholderiaceae bacterium]